MFWIIYETFSRGRRPNPGQQTLSVLVIGTYRCANGPPEVLNMAIVIPDHTNILN